MLAKIKFVSSTEANRLHKDDIDILSKFLGEDVDFEFLAVNDEGKIVRKDWKETFDPESVSEDTKLVEKSDYVQISDYKQFVVDLDAMMITYPTLEYSVKGIPTAAKADSTNLIATMASLSAKLESSFERFNKELEFNQKCEVHVPNMGLMNINKLAYATNKCTEELQDLLDKGWRILSICPQPDQRRPDYILGMHDSESSGRTEVKHF